MTSVTLSTYALRVFPRSSPDPLILNNLGNGLDFLDILQEYLRERHNQIQNDLERRVMIQVERFSVRRRVISGIMNKGNYGLISNLLNVNTRAISYTRSEIEAEMMPFYFQMAIPRDADEGIIALQKTSNIGIKLTFEYELKDFIRDHYPDYRIEMNSLVPAELLERYLGQGRVTQIRFIKYGIPQDITDVVNLGNDEHHGTTELIIKARRGESLDVVDRVRQIFNHQRNVNRFIEIQSFEYEDVKIQFSINGKYRTIDLLDQENLRGDYDIGERIETRGGNPVFESINSVATEIVRTTLQGIGLENNDV